MKIIHYWPEVVALLLVVIVVTVPSCRQFAKNRASVWVEHVSPTTSRRIALGLGAAAAVALFAVGGAKYPARAHVVLGALCVQAAVLGLPWLAARTEREQAVRDAEAAARADDAITTALEPLADVVLRCVGAEAGSRPAVRADAIVVALTAAATLVGGDTAIRATYYKVSGRGRARKLTPQRSVGRGKDARTVFKASEDPGPGIFKALDAGASSSCPDVEKEPPEGWKHDSTHTWRSFITVPITTSSGKLLGMLVADSPTAEDFNEDREPQVLRLVAIQLAAIITACP